MSKYKAMRHLFKISDILNLTNLQRTIKDA